MNRYKLLLFLSLMPYAAMILLILVVAVTGYSYYLGEDKAFGMRAAQYWLVDSGDYWLRPNIRHLVMLVCVTYQITYFHKLRTVKSPPDTRSETPHFQVKQSGSSRLLLKLSFIPYGLPVLFSIYAAIFGIDFLWSTSYGLEGAVIGLVGGIVVLFFIPILPVCIIYQIVYAVSKKRESCNYSPTKETSEKATVAEDAASPEVIAMEKLSYFNMALVANAFLACLILCVYLTGGVLFERWDFERRINNADVAIIKSSGIRTSIMLINYEPKTVSFIHGYIEELTVLELAQSGKIDNQNVQFQRSLDSPGQTITLFYPDSEDTVWHLTDAIELVMEDGKVYTKKGLRTSENNYYFFGFGH